MATTPGSNLDLNLVAFASRLLAVSETPARARVIAQALLERFPGTTSILYLLLEDEEGLCWSACATVGDDAQPDQTVPPTLEHSVRSHMIRQPPSTKAARWRAKNMLTSIFVAP